MEIELAHQLPLLRRIYLWPSTLISARRLVDHFLVDFEVGRHGYEGNIEQRRNKKNIMKTEMLPSSTLAVLLAYLSSIVPRDTHEALAS